MTAPTRLFHFLCALLLAWTIASTEGELSADEFKVGDVLIVAANEAKLMSGKTLVATLPRGRECKVERVSGPWVLTRLTIDGELRRGWVHESDLRPAAPTPKPKPAPERKPADPVTRPMPKDPAPAQKSFDQTRKVPMLKRIATLKGHSGDVYSLAFSADGKTLASGGVDQIIHIWDVDTRRLRTMLAGHQQRVRCLKFSPVMDKLLASGGGQVSDGELLLWNLKDGKKIADLPAGESEVVALDFSSDGMTLFSAGWSRSITIWDVISPARRGEFRASLTEMVNQLAVGPNGDYLANPDRGGIVFLRAIDRVEAGGGRPTEGVLKLLAGQKKKISTMKFSHDGARLATGSDDRSIIVWDCASGKPFAKLLGHGGPVSSLDFSPDGKFLVSGSLDSQDSLKIWELSRSEAVSEAESGPVFAVAFSPRGDLVASTEGQNIHLWAVGESDAQ